MKYLLISRGNGGFWRPDNSGYTHSILEAGLYDKAKADEIDAFDHSYSVPFDADRRDQCRHAIDRLNLEILQALHLTVADTN